MMASTVGSLNVQKDGIADSALLNGRLARAMQSCIDEQLQPPIKGYHEQAQALTM